jgi:uncharacterized protein YfaP (DUF2135 family)
LVGGVFGGHFLGLYRLPFLPYYYTTVSIKEVNGTVRLERETETLAARANMRLKNLDTVRTENNSSSWLLLDDVKAVELSELTALRGDQASRGFTLTLVEGEIRAEIERPLASDEDFTVVAGNLALAVHGTVFTASLFDDVVGVQVESGEVTVEDLQGNVLYTLGAGENVKIPIMRDDDRYRVVLTWNDEPSDIEANLVASRDNQVLYHVGYQSKNVYKGSEAEPIASLDQDITSGQGPEMITFTMEAGVTYDFAVSWFDGDGTWASSGATVHVYRGYILMQTYHVPLVEEMGGRWNVFTLRDSRLVEDGSMESFGIDGTRMWGDYYPLQPSEEYSYYSSFNYSDIEEWIDELSPYLDDVIDIFNR